jgi:hypothetical protein
MMNKKIKALTSKYLKEWKFINVTTSSWRIELMWLRLEFCLLHNVINERFRKSLETLFSLGLIIWIIIEMVNYYHYVRVIRSSFILIVEIMMLFTLACNFSFYFPSQYCLLSVSHNLRITLHRNIFL